ncbi:MAG: hypothetical protein GF307_12100 [candidate division Zixibacteria bacterium]|nr:hypothetical protein [candidate division Zixibacteria bacterium]
MSVLDVWTSRGLRFKLTTGILISLIPIMVIVLVTYNFNRSSALQSSENLINQVMKYNSEKVDVFLQKQTHQFENWVSEDVFGMAIEFNTLKEVEEQLTTMVTENPGFAQLVLTDKNGSILVEKNKWQNAKSFANQAISYSTQLIGNESMAVGLYPNSFLKELGSHYPLTYLYSFPTKNSSGEVNGLFLAYLDWDMIQEYTNGIKNELYEFGMGNATTVILDRSSDNAISHTEIKKLGSTLDLEPDLEKWLEKDNELVLDRFNYEDGTNFVSYAFLSDPRSYLTANEVNGESKSRLTLVSFIPESDVLGKLKEAMWISLIIAFAGASICIFIGYILDKSIARPIDRIIQVLSEGVERVGLASGQVASASQSLSQGATDQASSLEETSSILEEMSGMTRNNADNAAQAKELAVKATNHAEDGNRAMDRLSNAISEINNSSNETAKIIKAIDEIAFQTNLLALNAAVEAARAGEAGKGFAVVAEEVRNLAMRSAEAAKNTSKLIEDSQKNASDGVNAVEEFSSIMSEIIGSIKKVNELIVEVSNSSNEQSQGINQVNAAVSEIDQVTQQNAASAEETSSASEELYTQVQQLNDIVNELTVITRGAKHSVAHDSSKFRMERTYAKTAVQSKPREGAKAPDKEQTVQGVQPEESYAENTAVSDK